MMIFIRVYALGSLQNVLMPGESLLRGCTKQDYRVRVGPVYNCTQLDVIKPDEGRDELVCKGKHQMLNSKYVKLKDFFVVCSICL